MACKDRLCDYFAVVGPREADIENCVAPELYSISNMPRCIDEAICDICVVMGPKETVPPGYWALRPETEEEEETLKKHAYICFRRRRDLGANSSNSYITDIKVIRKGQEFVPEGFEMLEKTAAGASADLNKGGPAPSFLAIKRAIFTEESLMGSVPPPVLDLALCWDKKGDTAPMDFSVIPRQLNKLANAGEEVYLAYHHGPRPGICDIPYDAATLEWFPDENTHEDFPLPSSELPMFCFPRGLYLKHAKQSDIPMPSYFSFVFTSIDGDRVHVACLQFYEMLPDRVIKELEKRQQILMNLAKGEGAETHWDHDEDSVTSEDEEDGVSEAEGEDDKKKRHGKKSTVKKEDEKEAPKTDEELNRYCLFAPRCLCIITHWPFYRAIRSFLQQIYRFSLSPSVVPMERYISYFVQYLPLPPPGVHAMNLHLDLGLNDSVDLSAVQPIVLHLPDSRSLPLMDLDFDAPFCCLNIDNVLRVFLLMLLEERLVFISSSTSLLTETMETLLALLFPLEWRSCYIPRLPNKLHEILDAPGSFLLGIYVEGTTSDFVCPPLSDPVYIIDLDHNRITDAEGKPGVNLLMEGLTQLDSLKDKLIHELFRTKLSVRGVEQIRERDSAFELPTLPGIELEDAAPKLNTELIRDAFLCFMVETLGSYTKFFNSQDNKSGEDENQGVFMAFDVPAFVNSCDRGVKPLMERVVTTQMFATLVQQRMEHGHGIDRLVFFESCVQEHKDRKDVEEKKTQKNHWAEYSEQASRKSVTPPRSPSGAGGDFDLNKRGLLLPDLTGHLMERRASLLLHEAVALDNIRKQGIAALNVDVEGSTSPTSQGPSSPMSMTIIIPGPGIEGCGPPGTSYSYPSFPPLNKDWMVIPPKALHPILLEINSKRKKYMKKGNRMILARSVSECMKDLQAIGEFISKGGSKDKELHLAMQIFGIYFMCLPSRVTYQGKPLKVVMQAIGILQFLLGYNGEKYMDEAMWRSILVACGRAGHSQTRKIAIAIFEIIRRSGVTINALTYGQYTKALSEKDALEFPPENREEVDDCPWLEEKGQAWYTATCEASLPETLVRSRGVADSLRDLLNTQRIRLGGGSSSNNSKQAGEKQKKDAGAPLAEGEVWTSLLRDPSTSSYNTNLCRMKLDAGGVVGLSLFCICTNPDCQYMPLDEEIMTLRQDLLLISATDEHQGNLLTCPKCQQRITPKLYYEATTFKDYVKPAVIYRAPSLEADTSIGTSNRRMSASTDISTSRRMSASTQAGQGQGPTGAGPGGGLGPRAGSKAGTSFFTSHGETPRKRAMSNSQAVFEKTFRQEALRGEISGLGVGSSSNGYVDYISPFTLRMRMERLLLEHGEDSLTREWTREHHPEIFWNLVWYCTRLSVPFPLLFDTLVDYLPINEGLATGTIPLNSDGSLALSSRLRGYSHKDSNVEKPQSRDFFHEVVVVGWEDRVVRARCKVVTDLLLARGNIRKEGLAPNNKGLAHKHSLPTPPSQSHAYPTRPPLGPSFFNTSSNNLLSDHKEPKHHIDILGCLTITEIFPNISQRELDCMQDVGSIMTRKGVPGLKEAIVKFLYYRASFSGWTSEAALGCMYRVFVKLASHLRIKKLPTVAPLSNIAERPLFEQEYALAINKLTERQLRDQAEKDITELMGELPSRDALRFRSVFGQLF